MSRVRKRRIRKTTKAIYVVLLASIMLFRIEPNNFYVSRKWINI